MLLDLIMCQLSQAEDEMETPIECPRTGSGLLRFRRMPAPRNPVRTEDSERLKVYHAPRRNQPNSHVEHTFVTKFTVSPWEIGRSQEHEILVGADEEAANSTVAGPVGVPQRQRECRAHPALA